MVYSTHYVIGVSVGVMAQPTAIAIIEQEAHQQYDRASEITELRLRHLERLPVDGTYPDMAKRLREIRDGLAEKEKAPDSDLLVDMTGTGKSIIDFLKKEDLDPTRVVITSGHGEQKDGTGLWRVAKIELVGALQVLFQTEKFVVASGLELVPQLKEELTNFRMKAQAPNSEGIESWREGRFDDLVFATAIATWRAQRDIPMAKSLVDEWTRKINDPSEYAWVY
jgi:hypothetical protein